MYYAYALFMLKANVSFFDIFNFSTFMQIESKFFFALLALEIYKIYAPLVVCF
ncbi:hypothetical protein C2G38_2063490 [Gigaspora rosea]|uniref:Uncharacterized protein n=1 Tax=Gigaspora rosea TaxID=44941 RepID=A0A397VYD9_9GLOM|nr:hypothetical protein C2G38_2063490 [Gigaspora rosea]